MLLPLSGVKAGFYNNAFRWKTVMVWIQYESSAFIIPTVTFDFWICAIVKEAFENLCNGSVVLDSKLQSSFQ